MKHLGLIVTALIFVLLTIGLIGWVLTVRSDVTDAMKQLDSIQAEIATLHEHVEYERGLRSGLHLEQAADIVRVTNDLSAHISRLETNIIDTSMPHR